MIKTKLIETPKGRLLVVGGLPEAYSYDIHNEEGMPTSVLVWVDDTNCYPVTIENLPLGSNYELLGKLSEITEEQAKEVVDVYRSSVIINGPLYLRYANDGFAWDLHTAKGSLISLVESEVSLKNRLGEYPTEEITGLEYGMKYLSKVDDWEEEQQKIFTNPVLFWEPQIK